MSLLIRTATPADLDAIVRLHTEARATYYRGHLAPDAYAGPEEVGRSAAGWARAVDAEHATVLCAERDGALVGVAGHAVRDGGTTLTQLHVDPSQWRTGVGTALHSACTDAWRRAGVRTARLEVFAPNTRAQAFYAHHGWTADPDTPRDGTHLVLRLVLGDG
ncbi:GNAT family N-acetyltransferase [Streptomyces sp. NBC_01335]|uniref:GNAT family N-acetyltransferase n=1 Tax=Streptomyces sp. NBC_01335 TaxID=2903828 RepID=UPI002E0DD0D4|nr:GNAT family N-acetyltransferase [Streptomyces sp. NBC_01335]